MRRACAILLLGLIGLLPAVDTIACPDGCADLTHATTMRGNAGRCTAAGTCGLCLNGFFVYRDLATVDRPIRVVSTLIACVAQLPFVTPPLIEHPPRLT